MDQLYSKTQGAAGGEDPAAQRQEVRDSLFLIARFRVVGGREEWQVRVRNLSAGGLMAELPESLAIGTPVEVEVRGIGWVPGRIAWAAAGRVGVAFERAIDPKLARKPIGANAKSSVVVKTILPR
jgi:hypothetical protein